MILKGFSLLNRINSRTIKHGKKEKVGQMKVSAAIITTGILFLGGVSSMPGMSVQRTDLARKPAVQTVCSVKGCRKTKTHKHHSKTKHYNCGVSNCTLKKKHTHSKHHRKNRSTKKQYYRHHSSNHRNRHHRGHHA